MRGRYDLINIKLDKTGGLTEALALADEAEKLGFGLFVGCMVASSLAMAPALLLAGRARFVDLDGPLLLARTARKACVSTARRFIRPKARCGGDAKLAIFALTAGTGSISVWDFSRLSPATACMSTPSGASATVLRATA